MGLISSQKEKEGNILKSSFGMFLEKTLQMRKILSSSILDPFLSKSKYNF